MTEDTVDADGVSARKHSGNWQMHRRETGLVELVCEHGIGHPSKGSALWIAESLATRRLAEVEPEDQRETYEEMVEKLFDGCLIHGCDGCCGHDDFPGTWEGSLVEAHKIIRAGNALQIAANAVLRESHEQLKDLTTWRGFLRAWWRKMRS